MRLLLIQSMAADARLPELELARPGASGVDLIGIAEESGLFDAKPRIPTLADKDVIRTA